MNARARQTLFETILALKHCLEHFEAVMERQGAAAPHRADALPGSDPNIDSHSPQDTM